MLKKRVTGLLISLLVSGMAFTIHSEETTSPLQIYSGGGSIGVVKSMNEELQAISEQFLKLSFINRIYFTDNVSLFCDATSYAPFSSNFGAEFGVHYYFSRSKVQPFLGVGAGVHYFNHPAKAFGKNIGPSATARMGLALDITETFQVELQVPYTIIGNKSVDNHVGFQCGFLFCGPYRHVRKINMN